MVKKQQKKYLTIHSYEQYWVTDKKQQESFERAQFVEPKNQSVLDLNTW